MSRTRVCLAVLVGLLLAAAGRAADAPSLPLATASGTVDKVDKDSLTIRPRGPDGKFDKSIVLRLTGTSKIATLTAQKRGSKIVVVQLAADAKDLQPKQNVAAIYTNDADGPVLLSAVVQPAGEK
jgi:hypothetical protein